MFLIALMMSSCPGQELSGSKSPLTKESSLDFIDKASISMLNKGKNIPLDFDSSVTLDWLNQPIKDSKSSINSFSSDFINNNKEAVEKRFGRGFFDKIVNGRLEIKVNDLKSYLFFELLVGDEKITIAPHEISKYFYPLLLEGKIEEVFAVFQLGSQENVSNFLKKPYEIGLELGDYRYRRFIRNLVHFHHGGYLESLAEAFKESFNEHRDEVNYYLSSLYLTIFRINSFSKNLDNKKDIILEIIQEHKGFFSFVKDVALSIENDKVVNSILSTLQNINSIEKVIQQN